jgi:hypothetical protein
MLELMMLRLCTLGQLAMTLIIIRDIILLPFSALNAPPDTVVASNP